VWRAQVLPAVHGSRLMGILDGSLVQPSPLIHVKKADQSEEEVENPAHITWIAQDQQLLAYLLSSMTSEILVQVSSHEHVAQLWTPLMRCSRLSRVPSFCSFVLSYLGRRREMHLLQPTTAR